jgi:pimeloyl-ACP methyl ester carboxylesterase
MLQQDAPGPVYVMSTDGLKLATYSWGDDDAPVVFLAHGFASSATVNWLATGWVRDLTRAGFRVIALDQRGHGLSDKPHDPGAYTMQNLVADLTAVTDTYLVDDARFAGYSLDLPNHITRAVLGGIPDGDPLTRFELDHARAFIADGQPVDDPLTRTYLDMAGGIPGNDLSALVALVEGMRGGLQPDPNNPPGQPLLFATGSEDRIIGASRSLAEAAPHGTFFEIPGRNHFNAPTSRLFRDAAVEFLCSQ